MLKYAKVLIISLGISISMLFNSCMNGLEPLPSEVGELELSVSIPVAKSVVGLEKTYHIGPQNWFLNQNVPSWAKYDYIYYSDTVTVDLYEIYNKSESVNGLMFTISVWNEFPVKGELNISFIDNAGVVLYSFAPLFISNSDILFNGDIIRPGFRNNKESIDKPTIESLRTADRLVYHLKINLKDANTNSFQYFDKFNMKCHIGARVDFILKDI